MAGSTPSASSSEHCSQSDRLDEFPTLHLQLTGARDRVTVAGLVREPLRMDEPAEGAAGPAEAAVPTLVGSYFACQAARSVRYWS